MSGAALKWARKQQFGSLSMKALVNVIAARADQKGATWASQATLAEELGASSRHVRALLATLEALGVIVRTVRSSGRKGRLTDVITLSLHRNFDLSAKDVKDAKQARKTAVPSGTRVPVTGEGSNRNKMAVPSGTRVPGNSKGTTIYPYQEERQSERLVSYSEGNARDTRRAGMGKHGQASAYAVASGRADGSPCYDEDDPFGPNVVRLAAGGRP